MFLQIVIDVLAAASLATPALGLMLIGHSLGGGFAARIGATRLGSQFQRFVLVAAFLGPDAPPSGVRNKRWARPALPRIVALAMLRRFGLSIGEHLPVIAFATHPAAEAYLTPIYSFRLLADFGPDFNWKTTGAAIGAAAAKTAVVAGADDDLMNGPAFVRELQPLGVRVTWLPGIDHMGTCAEPAALAAIVAGAEEG